MVKFDNNIVQFGFGAVGKCFYEKAAGEISFNENKYFVIEKNTDEFDAFIYLGGMAANFIICEITKGNFSTELTKYLSSGDILIDFSDTVSSKDICAWCAERNIMYINTGNADWPENWLNIFEQNKFLNELKEKCINNDSTNKHPIVLQHGNNPGLVSHFVKAGISYIVDSQFNKDKRLKMLIKQNKFNEAAEALAVRMIHINDIDLQKINAAYNNDTLYNTWCIDTFLFEMLTEAAFTAGTHEKISSKDECKQIDRSNGFLEFNKIAAEKKYRTYYPDGMYEGFLVPHEETATIAKSLEVKSNGNTIYRPSVMFLYAPCRLASKYLKNAKVNDYPEPDSRKPQDCENENGQTIIRGYVYPEKAEIVYGDDITSGTEYVGVLLIGESFEPVWVGNRVDLSFLYRNKKTTYWQTPTITPVAVSALAAVCWMINNKDEGGIYFPEDIADYRYILKIAEKYISKTIYKTFSKETISEALKIDFSDIQAENFEAVNEDVK